MSLVIRAEDTPNMMLWPARDRMSVQPGGGGGPSPGPTYMHGNYMVLIDSLLTGSDTTEPAKGAAFFIQQAARDAGRFVSAFHPCVSVSYGGSGSSCSISGGSESLDNSYNAYTFGVAGRLVYQDSVITWAADEMCPWMYADLYYIDGAAATLTITAPAGQGSVVVLPGTLAIKKKRINNPGGLTSAQVVVEVGGFDCAVVGLRTFTGVEEGPNTLSLMFACNDNNMDDFQYVSDQTFWVEEFGIDHVLMQLGAKEFTNVTQVKEYWDQGARTLDGLGLTGEKVTLLRCPDCGPDPDYGNRRKFNGLWENLAILYGFKYISYMKIFGNYNYFVSSFWMVPQENAELEQYDYIHTSDAINSTLGPMLYDNSLYEYQQEMPVIMQTRWYTRFGDESRVSLNVTPGTGGQDFTLSARILREEGKRAVIAGGSSSSSGAFNFGVDATGHAFVNYDSSSLVASSALAAGWQEVRTRMSFVWPDWTLFLEARDASGSWVQLASTTAEFGMSIYTLGADVGQSLYSENCIVSSVRLYVPSFGYDLNWSLEEPLEDATAYCSDDQFSGLWTRPEDGDKTLKLGILDGEYKDVHCPSETWGTPPGWW